MFKTLKRQNIENLLIIGVLYSSHKIDKKVYNPN